MELISPALAAGFGLVALASYVVPGPDAAVIVPRALRRRRLGMAAAAGVQSGMAVHCLLAVAGVSAAVAARPGLMSVVQAVGGLYLIGLGVRDGRGLLTPRAATTGCSTESAGMTEAAGQSLLAAYVSGVGVNVLNPKAILFFVAILPQFVPDGVPVMSTVAQLALIDLAVGLGVWSVLVTLSARFARTASGTRRRAPEMALALVLVLLGAVFVVKAVSGVVVA